MNSSRRTRSRRADRAQQAVGVAKAGGRDRTHGGNLNGDGPRGPVPNVSVRPGPAGRRPARVTLSSDYLSPAGAPAAARLGRLGGAGVAVLGGLGGLRGGGPASRARWPALRRGGLRAARRGSASAAAVGFEAAGVGAGAAAASPRAGDGLGGRRRRGEAAGSGAADSRARPASAQRGGRLRRRRLRGRGFAAGFAAAVVVGLDAVFFAAALGFAGLGWVGASAAAIDAADAFGFAAVVFAVDDFGAPFAPALGVAFLRAAGLRADAPAQRAPCAWSRASRRRSWSRPRASARRREPRSWWSSRRPVIAAEAAGRPGDDLAPAIDDAGDDVLGCESHGHHCMTTALPLGNAP